MLQVILVRHGETDWNRERRIQGGNSDTLLNGNGREQAERLGLRLKSEKVQAIYSSPLKRARDTAQEIARYHGLEVHTDAALKELDAGSLEGVTLAELGRRLDELLTLPGSDAAQAAAAEVRRATGESLADLQQRAWDAIQRIVSQHSEGVVVVVSHYFVILTVICAVLDLPLTQVRRLRLGVSGISTIEFEDGIPRLTLFNDGCHLR